MSVRANKDTFESEINEAEKLVIADFYSDSCVPCKRMSPLLAETEEENPESIKLVKLNINFDGKLLRNITSQAFRHLCSSRTEQKKQDLREL